MIEQQLRLPLPPFFDPERVDQIWRIPYAELAHAAPEWRARHRIAPAREDGLRTLLVAVDMQNTFCIPGHELFVGGRSGHGAVDDVRRLCTFIYRNLGHITRISATMDTHQAMQIFHPIFWIDEAGKNPSPYTLISVEDVLASRWRINPDVAASIAHGDVEALQRDAEHYVRILREGGKYDLTIWPYHAMLGGISHALVSSLEEAIFFHGQVRSDAPSFEIKGNNPLTENYSVLKPEVMDGADGRPIAHRNDRLIAEILTYDVVILAGEAKSHCLAWSIDDLLTEIGARDSVLAEKVYLLEDCASPVVVPGVIDYTEQADAAFARFAAAGMHIVRSTDPMDSWPGLNRRRNRPRASGTDADTGPEAPPIEDLFDIDRDSVDFMSAESFPASDPPPPPSAIGSDEAPTPREYP